MYSGGGYNFGNYDPRTGREPSSIIGSQSAGNLSLKYLYEDEDENEEEEPSKEENIDLINKKIVDNLPMQHSDSYAMKNIDRGTTTKNVGGLGGSFLNEFSGHHMNTARKGISPYPQPKHTAGPIGAGGSSQAFKTTGNYKRTGTHKPHQHMAVENDENIFNLKDFLSDSNDVDIKNFRHQENKVKKVLSNLSV